MIGVMKMMILEPIHKRRRMMVGVTMMIPSMISHPRRQSRRLPRRTTTVAGTMIGMIIGK